ncbi:hypothetical protein H9P43_002146 [Blastocladiella emersonii ATCC 22665]|nr:hypothetical protein H9P43_002146 [Blastocladiella emersonii ATCC 22665]
MHPIQEHGTAAPPPPQPQPLLGETSSTSTSGALSALEPPGLASMSLDRARAAQAMTRLRLGTARVLLEHTRNEVAQLGAVEQAIAARIAVHELPTAPAPSSSPTAAAPEPQVPRPQSPPVPSSNLASPPPSPGSVPATASASASATVSVSKIAPLSSSPPAASTTSSSGNNSGSVAFNTSKSAPPTYSAAAAPRAAASHDAPSSPKSVTLTKDPSLIKRKGPAPVSVSSKITSAGVRKSAIAAATSSGAPSSGRVGQLASKLKCVYCRSKARSKVNVNPKQPRIEQHLADDCKLLRCPRELGHLGTLLEEGLQKLPELPLVKRGTGAGITEPSLVKSARDLAENMDQLCAAHPEYRPAQVALNALARMPAGPKRARYLTQLFNKVFVLQQRSRVPRGTASTVAPVNPVVVVAPHAAHGSSDVAALGQAHARNPTSAADPAAPRAQAGTYARQLHDLAPIEALKLFVHSVQDGHQPLHLSGPEDYLAQALHAKLKLEWRAEGAVVDRVFPSESTDLAGEHYTVLLESVVMGETMTMS